MDQWANIFTKALSSLQFGELHEKLFFLVLFDQHLQSLRGCIRVIPGSLQLSTIDIGLGVTILL